MNTKVVKVDREHPQRKLIECAGEILKQGGLVAFPTETVYGLGGDGLNASSSEKIYAAKGRPSDNPLIIHIADMESLEGIVTQVPEEARKLANAYWPGPLTMIFQKNYRVPYETTGGLESVAVRMPSHPVARALIAAGGGYIAAPSANTSGRPSPTRAEHVKEDLSGRIEMILDGGEVEIGLESTIVDFTSDKPVILRPGYISQEMIARVIGEVEMDKGLLITDSAVKPKAPGMKYRHYAPKAGLTIVQGNPEAVREYINNQCKMQGEKGLRAGVISTDENQEFYHAAVVKNIGRREDEEGIARHLFGILRAFDEEDVDCIYSEAFDTPQMGQAIKGSRTSHYIFGRAEGGNQMIALGCDHGGYELKQEIIKYLEDKKIPYKDFGCDSTEAVDYPIYARKVGNAILQGECEKGILICGTGIGISIAANKMKGIRAALCTDCFCAEATREHNDANVLALGGRVVGPGLAVKIVDTFLNTEFSHAPRHQHRIDLIEE